MSYPERGATSLHRLSRRSSPRSRIPQWPTSLACGSSPAVPTSSASGNFTLSHCRCWLSSFPGRVHARWLAWRCRSTCGWRRAASERCALEKIDPRRTWMPFRKPRDAYFAHDTSTCPSGEILSMCLWHAACKISGWVMKLSNMGYRRSTGDGATWHDGG
jgi:hypothetical protein